MGLRVNDCIGAVGALGVFAFHRCVETATLYRVDTVKHRRMGHIDAKTLITAGALGRAQMHGIGICAAGQ